MALRNYAYQFDDDVNLFRLPGYATAQFVLWQRLVRSLSAEVTLENAFDRVFYTAFTPTPNIGAPRLVRVGLKWDGSCGKRHRRQDWLPHTDRQAAASTLARLTPGLLEVLN